ncbi:Sas10/Utp3/C1D family-domain-containing protein [Coniochaeta sp. 2T2.1]|nr:Sas10/Utp3/C1D family-domain-containing protein [Coniochaeta sp. 2T2.1]
MDITDLKPQLDDLGTSLDNLEAALKPLLGDVGSVASKLPLLDKAKLNVLTCYAIESLLFSALRLNGVDAKEHAIMAELTRVKQYFAKIQKIENPPAEREATTDTRAAIRFIRSDLSDNKEVKEKLTEQLIKEGAKAALRASEKKRAAEDEASSQSEQTSEKETKKLKRTKSKSKR